ncbi:MULTISPECIES: SlyX family protein [unclassified Oleiphilus]|uniref:SlyX family protein n=1 Tax=unclassified Oleiphilus TaxID=2631174 RepID=UPI0007C2FDF1|nr:MULTISPECIES: SlyX family protein [unclassified Oleiphilus]KZY65853.1 hypothetical protein A3738_17735 [Oleiphilus sp. HI0066]KZY65992.1 hypothetical protein A3738_00605 [Oleiphilus sp. HI0066]KZY71867.1 hypothetical protein A3739_03865 [Oleiphilus sp. HI0067]MCH2159412.1 SlyX family protein [Oleiphilaceae bacterium]
MSLSLEQLTHKLEELEMKLAFQDDTIDTLNQIVTKQSRDIQDLWTANKVLKQSLNEMKSGNEDNAPEPPPPHY